MSRGGSWKASGMVPGHQWLAQLTLCFEIIATSRQLLIYWNNYHLQITQIPNFIKMRSAFAALQTNFKADYSKRIYNVKHV